MIDRFTQPLTFRLYTAATDDAGQPQRALQAIVDALAAAEPIGEALPDANDQLRPAVRWRLIVWRTGILEQLQTGDEVAWPDGRTAEVATVVKQPYTLIVEAVERTA